MTVFLGDEIQTGTFALELNNPDLGDETSGQLGGMQYLAEMGHVASRQEPAGMLAGGQVVTDDIGEH